MQPYLKNGLGSPIRVKAENRNNPNPKFIKVVKFIVVIVASLLFASFVSPQVSLFGRGLRLTLPLFILLTIITFLYRPHAIKTQGYHRNSIIFGIAYIISGVIRYIFDPKKDIFHNMVLSAGTCLLVSITIIFLRKGFPEAIKSIRWLTIFILGFSLVLGIPLLISRPGIARLTMGNPLEDFYAAEYYPKGVANYSWYTFVAIAFPVIVNWLYISPGRLKLKLLGWSCLFAAAVATILSTFTMATILLIIGAIFWLILVGITTKRPRSRLVAIILIITILFVLPAIINLASDIEGVRFVISKVSRFMEGIRTFGAIDWDETGRTRMFIESMQTFMQNPVLGAWGIRSDFYVGGHSSWADTLGAQGLFGLFLWFGFLLPSLRRGKKPFNVDNGSGGGTLSWVLFLIGGILNPTFYSPLGLGLIWLYDSRTFCQGIKLRKD